MKTRIVLAFLGFACFIGSVAAQCDLKNKKAEIVARPTGSTKVCQSDEFQCEYGPRRCIHMSRVCDGVMDCSDGSDEDNCMEVEFPDILKYVGNSYIMGVEYSTPKASETGYFTEYYEATFNRGRINSHIRGSSETYIYRTESGESWTLKDGKCNYENLTATPEFFKSDQTEWIHFNDGNITTVGPSAMFKIAYDVWNKKDRKDKMAYMGEAEEFVRGEKAVYWRRCTNDKKDYVDYYFADQQDENPFDSDLFGKQITPLRVSFNGVSDSEVAELSVQHYDIISFQHFIPAGFEPFQLPKGKNCTRSPVIEGPKLPDFSSDNLFVYAEVVYQKYAADQKDEPQGTFYSTFMFALDRRINHLAYEYSSWNLKDKIDDEIVVVNLTESIIYDMNHGYAYNVGLGTGKCEISRRKTFIPMFKFPKDSMALDLTNPYVLLPNNELSFLTSGKVRGMDVNIYEASVDNFMMGSDDFVPKALITHSYLKSNEKIETDSEVAGAPIQIDIRLFRKDNSEDLVTFNLFGYSTEIPKDLRLFDVTRCYRNDDDYAIFTIGFEIEPKYLPKISSALPEIERDVISLITGRSELNSVRIPYSMANLKSGYVFVTMVVLDKPPPQLDFVQQSGKTVIVASQQDDVDGVIDLKSCASNCLERRSNCWGFSMCGDDKSGTCYYGSEKSSTVQPNTDCTLYSRVTNSTYMQTKELQIEQIRHFIDAGEFMINPVLENDQRVQLVATYSRVDDPSENDSIFRNLGNKLNPRMRVQKAATKLKAGTEIKKLGKLAYDECQSLCLDFLNCETVSYCLKKSECAVSYKYGSELKDDEMEANNFCILLTRKYTDHFEHTPGVFVKAAKGTSKDVADVEECSRACLKETGFSCLSFDHCMIGDKQTCTLYSTHYLSRQEKADATDTNPRCGHFTKKFSNEFTRKDSTSLLGSKIPSLFNLTLEECAKTCVDYGQGSCYGYDFCQDETLYATSCTIFDTDPSRLESIHDSICKNFVRSSGVYEARPFTNSYAGGIGFLCFAVGGILGAIAVFVFAYIRVNRRG